MLERSRSAFACAAGVALLAAWTALRAQQPPSTPPSAIDFTRDIQPIFQKHCYECHSAKKSRAHLRLDVRALAMQGGDDGPVIVPGHADESPMVRRLLGLGGDDRMPKDADPLSPAQIALIRGWIEAGAVWPETAAAGPADASGDNPQHWAYRRPLRPPLPEVRHSAWARTPIDRFVLARLENENLSPSPEAPFDTLVRRVFLDLIGLPPSPRDVDEIRGDAARDGRDAAYARLVDRLLASPHYGERWARPWLDLARYADSNGFEKDNPRVMWKYRDWVIDALNADVPFDRFTIEQIAGDMLPNPTKAQLVATGFHRNAMTNEEGGTDPDESLYEVLVDRVNTTATVWLGTTLACAQCHNHKYDPFTQKDYYRLMAFFTNTAYESKTFGDGTRYFEGQIDLPTPEQEAKRKTIQAEIDKLNETIAAPAPDLERAQALWEDAARQEASTAWTVLTLDRAEADRGVKLTPQDDGSVIASGANPAATTYTIEVRAPLPTITALRLEALPDAALPRGGPGRDVYGNFQLNGLEIDANGPLAFKAIKADDSAGGANVESFFPKTLPRGAHAPQGWRIDASRESPRLPRQIVFVLREPFNGGPGARLRIRLVHQSVAVGQALGRFRLSVTSGAEPQRVVELPARLRPILAVAPADRTDQQRKDLASFHRSIAPSLKPARDRVAELQKDLRALGIPTALVMRERASYERPSAYVRRRGSFLDKGEQVYAGVPAVLHPLADDQMPNRLGLATWLVDERNPLTARVAVNRAWEQFFGRGLVETSEDFGTQGTPPSHPELLDWLATELVRNGWRMKALHRLIATSAAYRQSSVTPPALEERDPYNRLLARGPRFRMDAETVRDVVLSAAGLLSDKIGGPSVFPPQPDGIWDIPYSSEKWVVSEGADRYRRGLYVFIRRSAPYPSFTTFDATSRERCTVRRVRTNTPLQALTTLNDEAFFEAARALAARALKEGRADVGGYAFRLAATRTARPDELRRIAASYAKQLARFRKDPGAAGQVIAGYAISGVDPAEQAAWTMVANALLNLDETLTKE
jgi:mono/diheme cytochrome c family protein